jgi:hypothetical protein
MRQGLVECKSCRFWIQYTEEEQEPKPGLADIGLCHQFRSVKWLFRMHRDKFCGHGELRIERLQSAR